VSGYTGETMSFSSINAFAGYGGCQMAWALDRIYECPPDKPKGQQLVLGTAFDAGVKTAHDATLSGERPTPDVAIGAAIDAWNEEMATGKYATDQWSGLPGLLPSAVRQYVTEVAPTIRPIATQHPVRIAFDEVDWELVAKIDLLAESDLAPGLEDIIDAKATASSSTKYLAENDLQLDLYAIARSFEGAPGWPHRLSRRAHPEDEGGDRHRLRGGDAGRARPRARPARRHCQLDRGGVRAGSVPADGAAGADVEVLGEVLRLLPAHLRVRRPQPHQRRDPRGGVMSPGSTDRVMEARRQDVVEEIRAYYFRHGKAPTARSDWGLYGRARRAFGGSLTAALKAANLEGDLAADLDLAAIDVISPHPLPGLPRHLRERQILGGKLLEHLARAAQGDPRVLDDQETLGLEPARCVLLRAAPLERRAQLTSSRRSCRRDRARTAGRAELSQVYADGM
jgi:hypothetical protein